MGKHLPEIDWSYIHGGREAMAGMFRLSGRPGEREIGITLVSPFIYIGLLAPLLFAVIPNIFIGLAEKKVILLLPFPFFIWTALCLVNFFGMMLTIRMHKPFFDWKNSLYWPKRMPGAGNPRYRERFRAIALNDIAALQLLAPAQPNPVFGAHQLNAVLQDGTRQPLMRGPEKRLRQNGEVLAGALNIPLLDSPPPNS